MSTQNVASARRWFEEIWNQRRGEKMEEWLTPQSVCHGEGGDMCGVEAFRDGQHAPFLAAFPDLRVTVEGTVGEGDNVVVRWLATGTHTGEGLGLPPTGKHISVRGMTWIRFENGKMVEGWDCWNVGGLMQTLREAAAQPS